jgi:HD-like signal output (HDOD) protein
MPDAMMNILFVDDEEYVLDGLRRVTRAERRDWNVHFALGPEPALAMLAEKSFDLVVADMRMPGMSGAELLGIIRKKYPDTIRFMLTGHAELEQLLPNIGPIHQFLRKPCGIETLRRAVSLMHIFRKRLIQPSARRIVAALERLPAPGDTVSALTRAIEDENSTAESVAAVIESDPALTAKTLHLVNSSFFGAPRSFTRVADAVTRLGLKTIRHLALTSQLVDRLTPENECAAGLVAEIWQRAPITAERCRATARRIGLGPSAVDSAFLAGLLHEIGRIVLAWHGGSSYVHMTALAAKGGLSLAEMEERAYGAPQSVIGGYLLALWAFDRDVIEAVTHCARPDGSASAGRTPLTALHLVLTAGDQPSGDGIVRNHAYLESLHLGAGSAQSSSATL